jgi:hypothetical protein
LDKRTEKRVALKKIQSIVNTLQTTDKSVRDYLQVGFDINIASLIAKIDINHEDNYKAFHKVSRANDRLIHSLITSLFANGWTTAPMLPKSENGLPGQLITILKKYNLVDVQPNTIGRAVVEGMPVERPPRESEDTRAASQRLAKLVKQFEPEVLRIISDEHAMAKMLIDNNARALFGDYYDVISKNDWALYKTLLKSSTE